MNTEKRFPKPPRLLAAVFITSACAAGLLGGVGCAGESQEAERVELPVVVDASQIGALENDLGWQIELQTFRVGIADLELTTEGEQHAASSTLESFFIGRAYAHPGHYAGGEIIGEMPGRFIVDWTDDGAELGRASLIVGEYTGANFRFISASNDDGLANGDPLVGHSAHIAGVARRDGDEFTFEALVDQDPERVVIGAPFEATITSKADAALGLRAHPVDPGEEDTLFDGVDFGALDEDDDGHVSLEPDTPAYNRLKRALQVHDHYSVAFGM